MDNPLEQPAPKSMRARARKFAHDLAWGADNEKWGVGFYVASTASGKEMWIPYEPRHQESIDRYIKDKWDGDPPKTSLLQSLGFLELDVGMPGQDSTPYRLTEAAFKLLD